MYWQVVSLSARISGNNTVHSWCSQLITVQRDVDTSQDRSRTGAGTGQVGQEQDRHKAVTTEKHD